MYVAPIGWISNLSFLSQKLVPSENRASRSFDLPIVFTGCKTIAESKNMHAIPKIIPEGWSVNPNDFQYNLNIIGKVNVQNSAVDSIDVVAAFVNNECRGVTPVFVASLNSYYFFLSVQQHCVR